MARIFAYDNEDNEAWAPSETGYYIIRTEDALGTPGEVIGTVY